jgi:hypothetical protein
MELIFWAILAVSIVHVAEEYFGGFVGQMKRFLPETDVSQFVSVNMTFLIMCFIACIVAAASLVYSLSMAAVIFINVLFHVGGSIRLKGYSAGLISALLLYVPVSVYAYYHFWSSGLLTQSTVILSFLLGAFWMGLVLVHQLVQANIMRRTTRFPY